MRRVGLGRNRLVLRCNRGNGGNVARSDGYSRRYGGHSDNRERDRTWSGYPMKYLHTDPPGSGTWRTATRVCARQEEDSWGVKRALLSRTRPRGVIAVLGQRSTSMLLAFDRCALEAASPAGGPSATTSGVGGVVPTGLTCPTRRSRGRAGLAGRTHFGHLPLRYQGVTLPQTQTLRAQPLGQAVPYGVPVGVPEALASRSSTSPRSPRCFPYAAQSPALCAASARS